MPVLKSGLGSQIEIDGNSYLFFAGNNYLGLANHTALKKAAISSIHTYGLSFSASRETTGTAELHLQLERLLSEFKNKPDSIVFASGYMGNRILIHALKDRICSIYMDREAHPSIVDGVPAEINKVYVYYHCDEHHLEHLLETNQEDRPLIITDGVFALTGEIAPLDKIYPIALKYNGIVVVDDAHATGILGKNGRGTPEHFGLDDSANLFQTETMSKAFGTYGGFISSTARIIDEIRTKSSIYIASTALPPPIVASGIGAIRHVMEHPELRRSVLENASHLRSEIRRLDLPTNLDDTPIIPIFFNSQGEAKTFSDFLYQNLIIAPYVRYPVQQDRYIVRITVSAIHTKNQIETLLQVLRKWRDRHDVDEN
jgi:7-keto-8-aminopelargonate synthetase-like enzyme